MQPKIADLQVTKHILKAFKLRAVRHLGQNFLIDKSIVDDILELADIQRGEDILEIGPGIGTLTQGLLAKGGKVTAIEIDKKLPTVLQEIFPNEENLKIIEGDILKIDLTKLMENRPFKVVSNLPYYITTPILMKFLEENIPFTTLITMVQKEVALRMVASPGSKDYGSLTVAMNYYTEVQIALEVPPTAFYPSPKVDSAVIICKKRLGDTQEVKNEKLLFRLVRGAFNKRRKTLLNALQSSGFDKDRLLEASNKAEIDLKRRGETLSIEEFKRLSEEMESSF